MLTVTARMSVPEGACGLSATEVMAELRAALQSVAERFGGELRQCDPRPLTWEADGDFAHKAELVLGLTNNELRSAVDLPDDLIDNR